MILLAIDGNSIVNRAFYGIKLLSTKDGSYYTNAIQGFLNILLKLKADYKPDAVAIAFDVRQPTFRHIMYSGYKANRHGMPEELACQVPILKEILTALGYKLIECPGFEADDILGTLAYQCGGENQCYVATGDRDSLQLVRENVTSLIMSTKMGQSITTSFTPQKIKTDYSVADPRLLIDVKALQGDTSDCIPGVAGIGPKTAQELVSKYGTIDEIYNNIDSIDIRKTVKDKLLNDREKAYLSRTLGTIRTDAPVDTNYSHYVPNKPDNQKVTEWLVKLEMFKMLERFHLKADEVKKPEINNTSKSVNISSYVQTDLKLLLNSLKKECKAYFLFESGMFYFASANGTAIVLPDNEGYTDFCSEFLCDKSIHKYTYNVKSLYKFFYPYQHDICINSVKGDCMLSCYVINPSASGYDPERLITEYCGVVCGEDVKDKTAFFAAYLPLIFEKTGSIIAQNGQQDLLSDIELPLSQVLASMECEGFAVNTDALREFGEELGEKASLLVKKIYEAVGYEFNINSPKQLGTALFEKLGLPAGKKTKTGYSTSADVLENLSSSYSVVADILEYRTVTKLKSTYCDGLAKAVGEDGRIHSSFNQVDTRTGRISSTEPNLQNIPVRTALGREMRKFFVAGEGKTLADADYSQIELRVLAAVANDKNMIRAFADGEDIHAITASQVFGIPLEMITPEIRSKAKAVNFGIVYGISAFSLSKQVNVSVKEADRYIKDYLENFSGIRDFMKNTVAGAKVNGYVSTLFSRRRYIPEINSSSFNVRSGAERIAMNMPIQGTAADIIKIAMIRVYNALKNAGFKSKLILQIHDELIIEAAEDELNEVRDILKTEMENAARLSVALRADVGTGKTWYEAKA
ncbi:MAG: DNA polymerase I [Clostridiales bacterium]|nr:DNA polymerase I [Clostridiales bacterium]